MDLLVNTIGSSFIETIKQVTRHSAEDLYCTTVFKSDFFQRREPAEWQDLSPLDLWQHIVHIVLYNCMEVGGGYFGHPIN